MSDRAKPQSPALERVKAQTEVLLPVMRRLREELGAGAADELVFSALRESSRQRFKKAGAKRAGTGSQKWREITDALDVVIGDAVEREPLRDDDEAYDYNVTGCRFAEFFHQLGESKLGEVLTCEVDHHVVEVSDSEVEMTRTQTIMRGAPFCKFRYRFSDGAGKS